MCVGVICGLNEFDEESGLGFVGVDVVLATGGVCGLDRLNEELSLGLDEGVDAVVVGVVCVVGVVV